VLGNCVNAFFTQLPSTIKPSVLKILSQKATVNIILFASVTSFLSVSLSKCRFAPVTHRDQGNCALSAMLEKHRPWSIRTPENHRCHAASNC